MSFDIKNEEKALGIDCVHLGSLYGVKTNFSSRLVKFLFENSDC